MHDTAELDLVRDAIAASPKLQKLLPAAQTAWRDLQKLGDHSHLDAEDRARLSAPYHRAFDALLDSLRRRPEFKGAQRRGTFNKLGTFVQMLL